MIVNKGSNREIGVKHVNGEEAAKKWMQGQVIVKGSGITDDDQDEGDQNHVTNVSFPYRSPDWDFHSQRL